VAAQQESIRNNNQHLESKIEGSLSFIWETKLKVTKAVLKEWAKTDYKEPIAERKEFQQQLVDLQDTMECTAVSQ